MTKHTPKPDTKNVQALAGSSASTGNAPQFTPVEDLASPPKPFVHTDAYMTLPNVGRRTSSQRLADLAAEHERLVQFYNYASTQADDRGADPQLKRVEAHADRILTECEALIRTIPAKSIHDLGLKARVLTWDSRQWWQEPEADTEAARNLIGDILSLAELDQHRLCDATLAALSPGYDGPPHHVAPSSLLGPTEKLAKTFIPSTMLEQMARDYGETYAKLDAIEGINDELEAELGEHLECTEKLASFTQARTAKDALFHTLMLNCVITDFDSMLNNTPEVAAAVARARRFLYSISGVLEQVSGISADLVGAQNALRPEHNPFRQAPAASVKPDEDQAAA